MTGWYARRSTDRSARAVIALTALAVLLLTAVPVALFAAVIMMILGHIVGGLAVFGGSVLAAVMAVALAWMTGMQHLRKLLSRASFNIVQVGGSQDSDGAQPDGSEYADAVRLNPRDYTEVR